HARGRGSNARDFWPRAFFLGNCLPRPSDDFKAPCAVQVNCVVMHNLAITVQLVHIGAYLVDPFRPLDLNQRIKDLQLPNLSSAFCAEAVRRYVLAPYSTPIVHAISVILVEKNVAAEVRIVEVVRLRGKLVELLQGTHRSILSSARRRDLRTT